MRIEKVPLSSSAAVREKGFRGFGTTPADSVKLVVNLRV